MPYKKKLGYKRNETKLANEDRMLYLACLGVSLRVPTKLIEDVAIFTKRAEDCGHSVKANATTITLTGVVPKRDESIVDLMEEYADEIEDDDDDSEND